MESNKSAALASSLTGIICDVRIRRSAGEHRTRLTSANRQRRRHWPPDAMARRCHEFVDSRLRRSPPDRASAVPYGQAGENATCFPQLAHRSAAAHKLHSTPQQDSMNLISGNRETPICIRGGSVPGLSEAGCRSRGVEFAPDSPLEGDGFEPSVPRKRDSVFRCAPDRTPWEILPAARL